MSNSIIEITSNGQKSLCYAENFGSFYELMELLNEVRHAKEQTPTLDESSWLTHYFDVAHGLRLFCTRESAQLLKPLMEAEFLAEKEMLRLGNKNCRHIVIDYDADVFSHTEWSEGNLETMKGSLHGLLQAYKSAQRKKNATQTYLKNELFEADVEKLCSVIPTPWRYENQKEKAEATHILSPEREQELLDRLIGYVGEYFGGSELYDILHHALEMSHEDMEGLGFDLHDYYEAPDMGQKM